MNDLEVFFAALDVREAEQDTVVRRLCAGDELLLRKVQALLKAHKRTDHFLDRPPTRGRPLDTSVPAVGERPGDQIGRYKLLQQIGEGGWGIVFMAEQEQPIRANSGSVNRQNGTLFRPQRTISLPALLAGSRSLGIMRDTGLHVPRQSTACDRFITAFPHTHRSTKTSLQPEVMASGVLRDILVNALMSHSRACPN